VSTRAAGVQRVLLQVLVLNLVVLAVKVVVGLRTGSLAVLGAALESGLDTLNNVLGVAVVRVAAREPDEDHPYGHAKFETLGALAIVGFLSISCFELLRGGVQQVLRRHVAEAPSSAELAMLALTLVVNLAIVAFERKRGRELGSDFLLADAAHTGSDVYVTLLALASLIFAALGMGWLDPVLAIVVALIIAWNGYQILRETIPVLVDERGVDSAELARVVSAVPEVRAVRLVRSRATSSGILFAEVTVAVDGATTVDAAHRVADAVEQRIAQALGASEVTVHVEPA
jgi:cation diffusion facilitator family transporter